VRRSSCLLALLVLAVTGDARGREADSVRVPAGFRVEVYATGLDRPTALAWGGGGRLYATQESGAVVRVKPRQRIARGFRTPLGLAWDGEVLFVSAQGTLWRVEGGRRRPVAARLPFGRHQQDNVVVHRGRLYLGSGSTCDACREKSRFGWPGCWPSYRLRRLVGSCAGVTRPVAYLEPHSSADGLAVYRGSSFPARYRGNLFVAEWGEYLSRRHGRKVSRVVLRAGRPALVSTFATGFEHPIAVTVDPLGALLVADYGRGVIYRVQARGKR
jgi:glucose/arabinose dehydrogenase